MIVKSLRYKNFRQFKGEKNIEFASDKEKNVTIILGNNTYGKTTLLQMFNWCFYDEAIFNDNPKFLLNLEVSNEMFNNETKDVEIEIILEHDNKEYFIFRKQEYIMINGTVIPKQSQLKISYRDMATGIMGYIKKEKDKDSLINTILPKELSGYFFFDTERVQNVSGRKDLTEAVKGLLGLSVLDNTKKHLGKRESKTTVIGSFYADMNLNQNLQAEEALKKIQFNQDQVTIFENQKEECEAQIDHYEERREVLENKLRDNEKTAILQKQKDDLIKNINKEHEALDKAYGDYKTDFGDLSVHFFAQPLINQASEFLKEAKVDDKGIKDVTAQSILEIIKRGRCLCGCEIVEGNKAYKHLMDELKYVPPESIGTTIKNFKFNIISFNSPNAKNKYFENLKSRMMDILRFKTRIVDWEDEVKDIEKEIEGKEDTKKYQLELNDIKQRLKDQVEKKEGYIAKISSAQSEKDRFKKVYDSLIAASTKNREIMRYLIYSESMYNWIDNHYREKEIVIRGELEKRVNNMFEKMYHGKRKVVINDKYQTTLLTNIGDKEVESGESEGLLRVKNFAFIAGLVDLARSTVLNVGGKDLGSEPYPLILDAPFSNADEVHIKNISRELPKVAEQVIMFVMQKDWKYAEPVILDKVDKQYSLEKHSDTYTTIC